MSDIIDPHATCLECESLRRDYEAVKGNMLGWKGRCLEGEQERDAARAECERLRAESVPRKEFDEINEARQDAIDEGALLHAECERLRGERDRLRVSNEALAADAGRLHFNVDSAKLEAERLRGERDAALDALKVELLRQFYGPQCSRCGGNWQEHRHIRLRLDGQTISVPCPLAAPCALVDRGGRLAVGTERDSRTLARVRAALEGTPENLDAIGHVIATRYHQLTTFYGQANAVLTALRERCFGDAESKEGFDG